MTRTRLDAVCHVSWGDTTKTKASYVDSGYPAYSASGRDGFLPYFDHEGPGIVLSAIGAQCGKTWFAGGQWSCIKNTIYIKTKSPEADPRFVFYATCDPNLWPKRGAAQPFISQTDARAVEIPFPSLPVQRRIAGVLGAYDDLIENCERRIKVLDEMARALYVEWIDSRASGRQLPAGWRRMPISQALTFESGQPISKAQRGGGDTLVFGANGVIGRTSIAPMSIGGIVMGKIGSCGALRRTGSPLLVSNNAFLVRPAEIASSELAWNMLRSMDFSRYVGGAANPYLPLTAFGHHEVVVPSAETQAAFGSATSAGRTLTDCLDARIESLRTTRDFLLPRLLSGQLTVAEVE